MHTHKATQSLDKHTDTDIDTDTATTAAATAATMLLSDLQLFASFADLAELLLHKQQGRAQQLFSVASHALEAPEALAQPCTGLLQHIADCCH